MIKVILIEADLVLAESLRQLLTSADLHVDVFRQSGSALPALNSREHSLRIIRREMPDGDSLSLLPAGQTAAMRIPTLIISSRDVLHERIEGLNLGADDYLVLPFANAEFSARIRTLLRRAPGPANQLPAPGGLSVDCEALLLRHAHLDVTVSRAEIEILRCLIQAEGHAVQRRQLEQVAWGYRECSLNTLNVALWRLRRKLRTVRADCQIMLDRRQGYALMALKDTP